MSEEVLLPYTGFEGAEKKIEVSFRQNPNAPNGLRSILPSQWQSCILDLIHCSIVGASKNEFLDAYVLSESSLFVYPYKVILKTCGTTTLLNCLGSLIQLAYEQCNLEAQFLFFSRKSLKYPERQLSPHTSLDEEIAQLRRVYDGHMYTIGPHTGEHWVIYCAEINEPLFSSSLTQPQISHIPQDDQTLEILMQDLDPEVMSQFYMDRPDYVSAAETLRTSGIANLFPNAIVDEIQFEPCGFSVNAIQDDYYFTIHITPEPQCSFVSFETNISRQNYTTTIASVLNIFKPGQFMVSLFVDANALCCNHFGEAGAYHGFHPKTLERLGYHMNIKSFNSWQGEKDDYNLLYASFESVGLPTAVTQGAKNADMMASQNIGAAQVLY